MIKRSLIGLAVLVALLGSPAISNVEPLYIYPSFLIVRWPGEATIRLTPIGQHSVSWDIQKGNCYSYQIASANVHGWRREGNSYYFPATVER